jgi:VWFA-related protein
MDVHRFTRRLLLAGLVLVSVSSALFAQKTSAPTAVASDKTASNLPTLSVDARLVSLPVVVRDKKGALVQSFGKDDFDLKVDGKSQTIRYFDKDTNLPLILGLLVDTSLSQRSVLDEERSASGVFLDQMLTNPKDQAFIIQFARETELLQDLTSSRPKLQAALKEIDTPSDSANSSNDPNNSNDTSSHRSRAGGTVLFDALFLASDELMSKSKGRKALIILSDGADSGSRENITRAIEASQRADTVVYAIYFKGDEPARTPDNSQRGGHGGYPGGGGMGYPGGLGYPGGGRGGYPGSSGGNYPPQQRRTDGKDPRTHRQ